MGYRTGMDDQDKPRRPGRPATGHTPHRVLRVGPIWDTAQELARQRGETMTQLVIRAITLEVARLSSPPPLPPGDVRWDGQRLSVGGQTLAPGRYAVPGTDGVIEVVSAPGDDLG